MQSKAALAAALLSTSTLVAGQITLSPAVSSAVAKELALIKTEYSYVTSLTAGADFSAALAAIMTAIPPSLISQAESNPQALISQFLAASGSPTWLPALPTQVVPFIQSVESAQASILSANGETVESGLKFIGDEVQALLGLFESPQFSSVVSELEAATGFPASFVSAFQTAPLDQVLTYLGAGGNVPWATAIPSNLQPYFSSVLSQQLSILTNDIPGAAPATATPAATGVPASYPTGAVTPTTFGTGVLPSSTAKPSVPITPSSGAAPSSVATLGFTAMVAAAGLMAMAML